MTNIPVETTAKRAAGVLDTTVGDTIVLLSTSTGNYVELNRTSSAIWSMIDGETDIATIVANLTNQYDVEPAECGNQVQNFVGELLNEKLVVTV